MEDIRNIKIPRMSEGGGVAPHHPHHDCGVKVAETLPSDIKGLVTQAMSRLEEAKRLVGKTIVDVKQTQKSSISSGLNVIQFVANDGSVIDFEVRNGEQGLPGKDANIAGANDAANRALEAANVAVNLTDAVADINRSMNEAEAARAAAEAARVVAEQNRKYAFDDREERLDGIESSLNGMSWKFQQMIKADNDRTTAESARVAAENARVSAESARSSAESARVDAETSRNSAEAGRVTSEAGRVSSEAARVAAETARESASAAAVSAAEAATESANSAAESASQVSGKIDALAQKSTTLKNALLLLEQILKKAVYTDDENAAINAYKDAIDAIDFGGGGGGTTKPATPVITLSGASATITCSTSGATIYYTTNGNTPTSSSSQYSSAVTLTNGQTIKAIAIKDGVSSNVASSTYSQSVTYYTITNNLTNCANSNNSTQIASGSSYSATISANSGYTLGSVNCTMGGSSVSVSNGAINISSVSGNIVITASASADKPSSSSHPLLNLMNPLTIGKTASASGTSRPNIVDGASNRAATEIVDISSLASSLGTITITSKTSYGFACYFGNGGTKDNITTWAYNNTLTLDISSCTKALFLIQSPTSTDLNDHLTIS